MPQRPSPSEFLSQQGTRPSPSEFITNSEAIKNSNAGQNVVPAGDQTSGAGPFLTSTGTLGSVQSDPGILQALWDHVKRLSEYATLPQMGSSNQINKDVAQKIINDSSTLPEGSRRKVAEEAPALGGIIGGTLGGIPGAVIGGTAGGAYKYGRRAATGSGPAPSSALGAAGRVALSGGGQGLIQAIGQALPAALATRLALKTGLVNGTWGTVYDFFSRTFHPEIPVPRLQSDIPQDAIEYLVDRGVPPTAGELSGPGALSSIESVSAQTAMGAGKASKFLRQRQENLQSEINQIVGRDQLGPFNAPMTATEVGEGLQNTAAEARQVAADAFDQANAARASQFSGRGPLTMGEAGDTVVDRALAARESGLETGGNLYRAAVDQASNRGITVPRVLEDGTNSERRQIALQLLDEAKRAQAEGKAHIDEASWNILRNVAGQEQVPDVLESLAKDQYGVSYAELNDLQRSTINRIGDSLGVKVEPPPASPIADLLHARTGIHDLKTSIVNANGGKGNYTTGALDQLEKALFNDIEKSLPSDLAAQWRQGSDIIRDTHSLFNNTLMGSMLREKNPVATEGIMRRLLASGNETDIENVMKVVGNNPDAMGSMRRAAIDYLQEGSAKSSDVLKKFDQRPGLRAIFGPSYDSLRAAIEAQSNLEREPATAVYNSFLKNAVGAQNPESLVRRATAGLDNRPAPIAYASRLSRLVGDNDALRVQVGHDMIMDLAQQATKGGKFGAPEAHFDPVQFAQLFKRNQQTLGMFLNPDALTNMRWFTHYTKNLTLSHEVSTQGGRIAAKWKSLQTLSAGMSIGAGAVSAAMGNKKAAGASVVSLLALLAPRVALEVTLNPSALPFLVQGARLSPWVGQGAAQMMRLVQLASSDDEPPAANAPQKTEP